MTPRLALHHLALLAAIPRTGGIAAAAEALGITQSAASHRLAEAERRVGTALVRRAPGRARLTPEGQRLAIFAERTLTELARLEQDIEATGGRDIVRLGQATYSRYHWLPAFIAYLNRTEPRLTLDIAGAATARPLASLLEGRVDVSLVYGRPTTSRRLTWQRQGTDPLLVVMAPNHPLARRAHIESDAILATQIYSYPFTAEPGLEWDHMLGLPATPFRRITEMPTPEAVIDLVRAGFGIGFFSRWAVEPELANGTLVARPVGADGLDLDWWAVTRAQDGPESPAGRLAQVLSSWRRGPATGLDTLAFKPAPSPLDAPGDPP